MTAQRVRCSRAGGPFLPAGARYCGRGKGEWGMYGNPYRIGDPYPDTAGTGLPRRAPGLSGPLAAVETVALYAWHLPRHRLGDRRLLLDHAREHLAGLDLGCWCRPGDPCHVDVLLAGVNELPARPWVLTCGTIVALVEARTITGAWLQAHATWPGRSASARPATPSDVAAIEETTALTIALRAAPDNAGARRGVLAIVDTNPPPDTPPLFPNP